MSKITLRIGIECAHCGQFADTYVSDEPVFWCPECGEATKIVLGVNKWRSERVWYHRFPEDDKKAK